MIYSDGSRLITDQAELEELHKFAESVGLSRRWFRDKPGEPSYDIFSGSVREMVKAKGARFVIAQEIIQILRARLKPHDNRNL